MRRTIAAIVVLLVALAGLLVLLGRVLLVPFFPPIPRPSDEVRLRNYVASEPSASEPALAAREPEPRRTKAVLADDTGKDWLGEPHTDLERRLESTNDTVRQAAIDEVIANHAGDVTFLPALIRSWRVGRTSRFGDMTEFGFLQSFPVVAMREWALPFLLETLRHPRDAEFAVRTLQVLGNGALRIIPDLCYFAESDDRRLRLDALRVLSHGDLALQLESRIEFFKPMLADPDPWVVIHAVDILGRNGYSTDELIRALEPLKGHADVQTSMRASGKIFNFNYRRKHAPK